MFGITSILGSWYVYSLSFMSSLSYSSLAPSSASFGTSIREQQLTFIHVVGAAEHLVNLTGHDMPIDLVRTPFFFLDSSPVYVWVRP